MAHLIWLSNFLILVSFFIRQTIKLLIESDRDNAKIETGVLCRHFGAMLFTTKV